MLGSASSPEPVCSGTHSREETLLPFPSCGGCSYEAEDQRGAQGAGLAGRWGMSPNGDGVQHREPLHIKL